MDFGARVLGCLLGGAVGDALGAPVEFHTWDRIRERYGPEGVTAMEPPYHFTDDTQMTLFTCEGLIRASVRGREKGICHVPGVVRHAYLRWLYTQGVPWPPAGAQFARNRDAPDGWLAHEVRLHRREAPGNTCLSALAAGGDGSPESPINDSKGCGAVMRAAPVGLALRVRRPREVYRLGCEIGALTHGHPDGWHSAGALAVIVAALVNGATVRDAVNLAIDLTSGAVGTLLLSAVSLSKAGHLTPQAVEQHLGDGWVGDEALAIAVACAVHAVDFRSGVLAAVNHSGDTDSTGAICGNILGTAHGPDQIPPEWLEVLDARDLVDTMAHDLIRETVEPPSEVGRTDDYPGSPPTEEWEERYPGW